jgi:hypothetical protein
MDLSARISSKLHIAVLTFAARHSMSVETVVARALSEYLADVDAGLLTTPAECRALYSTAVWFSRPKATVDLFGVRARGGRVGRPSKASLDLAARKANVGIGERQQLQKGTVS